MDAVKYGLDVPTSDSYSKPQNLIDLAVRAEDAGWDGFFLWDGLWPQGGRAADTTVMMSAIAARTERIRIGVIVTSPARRRPWKLARELLTLDHLSRGRVVLGVGLGFGDADYSVFGEDSSRKTRAEKLDESLAIIAGLWSGRKFSYFGKHYQVAEARYEPAPVQKPRIPIWVAGYWPNAGPYVRASRWDGIVPGVSGKFSPEQLTEAVGFIRSKRRSMKGYDIVMYGHTPTDKAKAAKQIERYARAGATWWLEGLGLDRGSIAAMKRRVSAGPPTAARLAGEAADLRRV